MAAAEEDEAEDEAEEEAEDGATEEVAGGGVVTVGSSRRVRHKGQANALMLKSIVVRSCSWTSRCPDGRFKIYFWKQSSQTLCLHGNT